MLRFEGGAIGLSSIVHHMGLVVLMATTGSSGRRWFDVDTIPSNDDGWSAGREACQRMGRVWVSEKAERTKVPSQTGGSEDGRIDAQREQPTSGAECAMVDSYPVLALSGPVSTRHDWFARRSSGGCYVKHEPHNGVV